MEAESRKLIDLLISTCLKKKVYLPLLFFPIVNLSIAQTASKSIHVFNNKLTMSVPWDVNTMTADEVRYKYKKAPDKNSFYYANKDLSFSIALISVAADEFVKRKYEIEASINSVQIKD